MDEILAKLQENPLGPIALLAGFAFIFWDKIKAFLAGAKNLVAPDPPAVAQQRDAMDMSLSLLRMCMESGNTAGQVAILAFMDSIKTKPVEVVPDATK